MFSTDHPSFDSVGANQGRLPAILLRAQKVAQAYSLPVITTLAVLLAIVEHEWTEATFDRTTSPGLSLALGDGRQMLVGGIKAYLIAASQAYMSPTAPTYPPTSSPMGELSWNDASDGWSTPPHSPSLDSTLKEIRHEWPTCSISAHSIVWGLLRTDSTVRSVFSAVKDSPHAGQQFVAQVAEELRTLVAQDISATEYDLLPQLVPSLPLSPRAVRHITLTNQVMTYLSHLQGPPCVVSGYDGSGKDVIPDILADKLALPKARQIPLRSGQKVFRALFADLLACMEVAPDHHHLHSIVKYVAGKQGLLVLEDLEELAVDASDAPEVRARKMRLLLEFKGLKQSLDPDLASVPIVALHEVPLNHEGLVDPSKGVEATLKLRPDQDIFLVTIDHYSEDRAIGCLRDYFLVGWYDGRRVTFPSIGPRSIEGLRAGPAQTDELRSNVDPHLRKALADAIDLEFGICKRSSGKPLFAPYLYIRVVEQLIDFLATAQQDGRPEKEIRARAFQAAANINAVRGSAPADLPAPVRAHYDPLLLDLQNRLMKMSQQPDAEHVLNPNSDQRTILTRDLIAAELLGSGTWIFSWPRALPPAQFSATARRGDAQGITTDPSWITDTPD